MTAIGDDFFDTSLVLGATVAVVVLISAAAWTAYLKFTPSSHNDKAKIATAIPSGEDGSGCCRCHPDLREHSKIFDKKVHNVADNVYVAVGFGLANSIMIVGSDGIIIIDTTESPQSAKAVLREFRKIEPHKPILGIVLTHFHHDHVGGTSAFLEDAITNEYGVGSTQIWAHETTQKHIRGFLLTAPLAYARATKMYGTKLNEPARVNCGIGPCLVGTDDDDQKSEVCITHTYEGPRRRIEIAGIQLDLIHAPGETDDQTVVFLPHQRILFAADNYYESFPNLYTIRGAPHRDVLQWAGSIDLMMETHPRIMVPSHTLPVHGEEEIQTRLGNYRDAIQYVHDQTVRQMLKHRHPDEIASELQLPNNLRQCEYLKEYYGTVAWSSKAIFHGYMGWYSGDECDLSKLTPLQYSHRLLDLAGSSSSSSSNGSNGGGGNGIAAHRVLDKAFQAYDESDFQWSLELSSAILRVAAAPAGSTSNRIRVSRKVQVAAHDLKMRCCTRLGELQISANGRNWYMTCAQLNSGEVDAIMFPREHKVNFLKTAPLGEIFAMMSVRFRPNPSLVGVSKSMRFVILPEKDDGKCKERTSSGKGKEPVVEKEDGWTLSIRNCVMYCRQDDNADADSDIVIETTESALRELLTRPVKSIASNMLLSTTTNRQIRIRKGDVRTFLQFLGNIDFNV